MKKSIFIVAILLGICGIAKAQLNVSSVTEKGPERLLVGQVSYSYLYKVGNSYEYWANTDNRYDETYTTLYLGDTVESAISTLNDLKSLMENEVAAVTVQQPDGKLIITYQKILGVRQLWLKQEGNAGRSWISLKLVNKFIDYFNGLDEDV